MNETTTFEYRVRRYAPDGRETTWRTTPKAVQAHEYARLARIAHPNDWFTVEARTVVTHTTDWTPTPFPLVDVLR